MMGSKVRAFHGPPLNNHSQFYQNNFIIILMNNWIKIALTILCFATISQAAPPTDDSKSTHHGNSTGDILARPWASYSNGQRTCFVMNGIKVPDDETQKPDISSLGSKDKASLKTCLIQNKGTGDEHKGGRKHGND